MDRKDLKIQALLEKISSLTAQYENAAADSRVEITVQAAHIDELNARIRTLEEPDAVTEKANPEND